MIQTNYSLRYQKQNPTHLYPVEFVIRAFLGTYPDNFLDKTAYAGRNILDLGYGDGRNMPLLRNIGFNIYGVEIHEDINKSTYERLQGAGIDAKLYVGSNSHLPFQDFFFDYILACHACYYVMSGETFDDNINEITRVLKPAGFFIASLPMTDTYILRDAKKLDDGHFEITNDPYGLRIGTVFRAFASEQEIKDTFSPYFQKISIGFCDDFFWGTHQKVWTIIAQKNI